MIQKDALDRYIESRGMSTKYRQSPVDAWRKNHGDNPVTKALKEIKIECTPEENDEVGAAIADEVGKMLQKQMQDIIDKSSK